ncbi:uncharacterized protein Z519_04748 [Cladophialophora bantiana CBS 173.52]|uniref:Fungal N-terminal domain-containing protein n=1 Tax=Cladophialophora bantiana (strain ATCC 10958 / CBS 173.52 / CDC B-1940 / NIH 8579) TaxID=1442370 RepID=A0A0D2EXQ7_CLAB1|nr:uncharacterized protein Z519_04748 [Cladophialophora bantiana CBS 173.52]KIW94771.1 hypothetical protein Z519_04748 [Cladophialophora bantiana CBS 173.52]
MDPGTVISVLELTHVVVKRLVEAGQTMHDAPVGLNRVINETEKLRVLLDRLSIFQKALPREQQDILDKQVSSTDCIELLKELDDLTSGKKLDNKDGDGKGEKMKLADRWWWLRRKDLVEDKVRKLQKQTEWISKRLVNEYLFEQHHQLSQSAEQVSKILELVMSMSLTLNSDQLKTPRFDDNGIYSPYKAEGIAWYGQFRCKPGQDYTIPYFRDRHLLADLAWAGNWNGVMDLLGRARRDYKQNWINCTSIYKATEMNKLTSGFRPLHQAAWYGDKSAAESLLKEGAWRLARTVRDTHTSSEYSTPLDVARDHGWKDLYEKLSPVIRRPVNHKALQTLQTRLHDLIKDTFGSHPDAHLECFILPELEILTEFDRSRIWFPLNPELLDTREGLAVHVILERNEIIAVMRWGRTTRKNYRISMSGVQEIQRAVVLR